MTQLQKKLFAHQNLKYKKFQCKLMPRINTATVIGIRMPQLRKIAKEFGKTAEAKNFLTTLPHEYFEENNIHGLLINECVDFKQCINLLNKYLSYVNNWASCDLLKPQILKKEPNKTLKEVLKWKDSSHPYTQRFAVLTLMNFYLDNNFSEKHLEIVGNIISNEYYVNMMLAWYYATALTKQWTTTVKFIETKCLPKWVQNKTIQKARESLRITPAQKKYLKTLKK